MSHQTVHFRKRVGNIHKPIEIEQAEIEQCRTMPILKTFWELLCGSSPFCLKQQTIMGFQSLKLEAETMVCNQSQ